MWFDHNNCIGNFFMLSHWLNSRILFKKKTTNSVEQVSKLTRSAKFEGRKVAFLLSSCPLDRQSHRISGTFIVSSTSGSYSFKPSIVLKGGW